MASLALHGALYPGRTRSPPGRSHIVTQPDTPDELEPRIRRIISRWGHDPGALVQVLREVQEECGYLPGPALTLVARLLRIPYSRAKGVASFYSFLSDEPLGAYRVLFSDNITDRMAGSESLLQAMCYRLWAEPGKVSPDGLVSIARTSCTGMCDQGPALLANGWAIPRLTQARIEQVAELVRGGQPVEQWPRELFVVEDNIRRQDILLDAKLAPGEAIRAALAIRQALPGLSEGLPEGIKLSFGVGVDVGDAVLGLVGTQKWAGAVAAVLIAAYRVVGAVGWLGGAFGAGMAALVVVARFFAEPQATFEVVKAYRIPVQTREHRMNMARHEAVALSVGGRK